MISRLFAHFSNRAAELSGHYVTFILAVTIVVFWAISGPLFHFSDTWQLVINTGTTIVTFMMVFLIQNSQNRDSKAVHLKLDELLRSAHDADNSLIEVEDETDEELAELKQLYEQLCQERDQLKERLAEQAAHPAGV
ncbi:MAG TPA: low affinity iron permease family protein [Thermomicrobiales bacterium]|nr:low affinity iron permease family protein [Thermomicrobiales bacterium]